MQGGNSKYFKIPNSNHKKNIPTKKFQIPTCREEIPNILKFQIPTTKRNIPKKKF
jgi:hypothetical protein